MNRRQIRIPLLLQLILLVFLYGCVVAKVGYADTYNFHFHKDKKKKAQPVETSDEDDEEDSKEEDKEGGEGETQASVPATKGQQPIIINNINNNDNANKNNIGGTLPSPVTKDDDEAEDDDDSSASNAEISNVKRSEWESVVSGILASDMHDYQMGPGVMVDFAKWRGKNWRFHWNAGIAFMGSTRPFANIDVELLPIRLTIAENWDLFRFGVFGGVGTLGAAPGNWASLHIGANASIYFTRDFAVTAGLAFNKGFALLNAGLTVNL